MPASMPSKCDIEQHLEISMNTWSTPQMLCILHSKLCCLFPEVISAGKRDQPCWWRQCCTGSCPSTTHQGCPTTTFNFYQYCSTEDVTMQEFTCVSALHIESIYTHFCWPSCHSQARIYQKWASSKMSISRWMILANSKYVLVWTGHKPGSFRLCFPCILRLHLLHAVLILPVPLFHLSNGMATAGRIVRTMLMVQVQVHVYYLQHEVCVRVMFIPQVPSRQEGIRHWPQINKMPPWILGHNLHHWLEFSSLLSLVTQHVRAMLLCLQVLRQANKLLRKERYQEISI